MRYALVNDERREAEPGVAGTCPGCGQPMIAKCGDQRIHHWAHRGMRTCDPWWEPETPWHRRWKAQFPPDWQEVVQHDETGERHIADVRTKHRLVLEFQHSHIRPQERQAREAFYRDMVWIVDGTRRTRDLPRFEEGRHSLQVSPWQGLYTTPFPQECFPRDWLDSRAPVFFDFAGTETFGPHVPAERRLLWGLLPGRAEGHAVVVVLARQNLVRAAHARPQIVASRKIVTILGERFRAARVRAMLEARRYPLKTAWKPRRRWRPRRRTARF
ncbi:MAG: competence protein [Mesorhizobium sp.]|nr:MAG: competence protein [Mesorhizobium sp.]RWJ42749.1 MAG: competence protein [Mesorhizobium sp.]RWJ58220.1 MAG: competence protein [Mesorhizobium sp.]RWJ63996.1 MAG: competence protein [Mesorhizobium sp.]RWJ93872.1 MAG: competence protein [Mesorhizobium sp.]